MTINLNNLRKTTEAATPGRWTFSETFDFGFKYVVSNEDAIAPCFSMNGFDAQFIAALNPATALKLIEIAEACARAERDGYAIPHYITEAMRGVE